MLPSHRLDCPRCLVADLLDNGEAVPRLPIWPTRRRRTFRGRLQVEMACGQCGYCWWSRHPQSHVMYDQLYGVPLIDPPP